MISYVCVTGHVLYSKCNEKILISLCVSHSKKFPEISYAKSCVLNMAAVLTLLYQRKLLTTRYVS